MNQSRELTNIADVASKVDTIARDIDALSNGISNHLGGVAALIWFHISCEHRSPDLEKEMLIRRTHARQYRAKMDAHWADEALMKCLFTLDQCHGGDEVRFARKAQVTRIKQLIERVEALSARVHRVGLLLKRGPKAPIGEMLDYSSHSKTDSHTNAGADIQAANVDVKQGASVLGKVTVPEALTPAFRNVNDVLTEVTTLERLNRQPEIDTKSATSHNLTSICSVDAESDTLFSFYEFKESKIKRLEVSDIDRAAADRFRDELRSDRSKLRQVLLEANPFLATVSVTGARELAFVVRPPLDPARAEVELKLPLRYWTFPQRVFVRLGKGPRKH